MNIQGQTTTIPFSGFYYSNHSEAIDNEICHMEQPGSENLNYEKVFHCYAKEYAELFNYWLTNTIGKSCGLKFENLDSPKFYNFETDRIFCTIEKPEVLMEWVNSNYRQDFENLVKDTFTNRPGFISYYSSDINDWPESITEWDHNQLGTLLQIVWDSEEIEELELMEDSFCNGFILECAEWENG